VRGAEIRKGAGLRKSVRINEACVVKSSLVAVHIIRGTVQSVGSARIAAGDTVVIASPGPAHCVPHRDVHCVRHKQEAALTHRYIYNLTGARWHTAHGRSSVLIHNMDGVNGSMLLLRYRDVSIARFGWRRDYQPEGGGQQKSH